MKQSDMDKAMQDFLAKNSVQVVPAGESGKGTAYANASERNAENCRYDSEGVFYIGGFK